MLLCPMGNKQLSSKVWGHLEAVGWMWDFNASVMFLCVDPRQNSTPVALNGDPNKQINNEKGVMSEELDIPVLLSLLLCQILTQSIKVLNLNGTFHSYGLVLQ